MKALLNAIIFSAIIASTAYSQEKSHVISHDGETIVTNPSKGSNSYKRWVAFPEKTANIRSIILNLKFQCPDSMRCADWDYLDYIKARPKNDSTVYEIARMLTPYGGFFQKDWGFEWRVDITDFSLILRDDVEIDYIHTGYEDNKTRGWKVTVDFEITYGTPVANPIAVHTIYDGQYKYGYKDDPIENYLVPITIKAHAETNFSKVKIHQTGHGMDANGCGEFCSKYRDIVFNGAVVDHKNLWMECGDNPLFPQAGTWIFDRANWCPGYLLQPDEVLLNTPPGKPFTVDINMEPYDTEKPSANEQISTYVIEYAKPNAKNDVTLVDIIQPSTRQAHHRKNPFGGLPVIRVKNNGANPLQKMTITYFLEGDKPKKHQWTGHIDFGDEALIALPTEVFSKKETAQFHVMLDRPNGKKDAFSSDNTLESVYERPDILPETLIVYYKTNNKPHQNTYAIQNSFGDVFFEKDSTNMKPRTVYQDTIKLKPGNYNFRFNDTAGDGLEFWFKAKDGRGEVKLLDSLGRAIKQFKSDFGSHINYNFAVRNDMVYRTDHTALVAVFPARTNGPITLDYFCNTPETVKVLIVDQENESKVLEEHSYQNFSKGTLSYDLSYLPKNRYYIKVYVKEKEIYKNRIRLKE
ncbi:peptide-N-glycosidase F-related protein [Tamlana sp. 2201CG12-4]|uniref:peptide-N-glycosidase F-related protein n=1 Tax=Tamlana sp. 2201CG12-4 TaxID=3112582 RepID=UPI002DB7C5D9|nr:peptide-N-glycosidase F-related protein [Tamlana sp. 2201CG12-4]MEC3906177.1 peptide-N-glycosidase F-related protein [Tamlana sp. 2201CG12-4]